MLFAWIGLGVRVSETWEREEDKDTWGRAGGWDCRERWMWESVGSVEGLEERWTIWEN